jgi:hypothetical protein
MASWTPGYRRRPPSPKIKTVGDHIRAHAVISWLMVRVFDGSNDFDDSVLIDDDTPPEEGEDVILFMKRGQNKLAINLSEFTTEELIAFRRVVGHAIKLATPIVEERDRIAKEAADSGDNVYYRSLRPSPKVSFFERRTGSNDPSV